MGKVCRPEQQLFCSFIQAGHTFLLNQFIFCKGEVVARHVYCGMLQTSWQMKFEIIQGNAAKLVSWWLFILLRPTARKGGSDFLGECDLHRNHGMVVILLYLLYNSDNSTLKLHQKKRSYPDEGWLFIGQYPS